MIKRRILTLLTALLVVSLLPTAGQAQAQPIVFVGLIDPQRNARATFMLKVYREAFRRLGYAFSYQMAPAHRASLMADSGQVDGELQRIGEYAQFHPNLVRVEESLGMVRFSAFAAKDSTIGPLDGWDSLKGTPYIVNYKRGVLRVEEALMRTLEAEFYFSVDDTQSGLLQLIHGRSDLYIDGEATVFGAIAADPALRAVRKVGLMDEVPSYAYLHKRHQPLAAKLARVLRDMKREGLIAQYQAEAEANVQAAP